MTRASAEHPTRRLVRGGDGNDYVVELTDRTITLRPKRARAEGAIVWLTPDTIYQRALLARAAAARPARKRVKRGLLSLGR